MSYDNFTTFDVKIENAVAWATFDYPPVNIQGLPMMADLNMLAHKLEQDREIKVVVFQSAHPEIFVAHADTNFLKDTSTVAVSRDEVKLLDLQTTLERISKLPRRPSPRSRALHSAAVTNLLSPAICALRPAVRQSS